MFSNPFTPIFGGKPGFFFGRKPLIERFGRGLDVRGSEDRALFVTGTRGCGKTTLVEHLSQCARDKGWKTVDVNAENALNSLFRQLVHTDTQSTTIEPQASINILGSGASVGGSGTTRTAHYTVDDLDTLMLAACARTPKGLFVSIDEIQKVPLDDVSRICGAFQMASRKGHDVVLVIAGLPVAYDRIIHHDGCTYMRRCVHEELGLFTREEVSSALVEAFAGVKNLSIDSDALDRLVSLSSGHPYMTQLLGYYSVEYADQHAQRGKYRLTLPDVETIYPVVLSTYERRSLQPLLDAMSEGELAYLRAVASVMDEMHVAKTGDIAQAMGKSPQQAAPYRQSLLDEGVILSVKRGFVRFNVPYLRGYVLKAPIGSPQIDLAQEWDV